MDLIGHKSAGEIARYSDQEMLLYDRLGPKTRATIGAAHRIIDIRAVLGHFMRTRQRGPDRWTDGNCIPSPPFPCVYRTTEGDADLARWIDEKVIKSDIGVTSRELMLVPFREGRITKLAMHLHRLLWRKIRQ